MQFNENGLLLHCHHFLNAQRHGSIIFMTRIRFLCQSGKFLKIWKVCFWKSCFSFLRGHTHIQSLHVGAVAKWSHFSVVLNKNVKLSVLTLQQKNALFAFCFWHNTASLLYCVGAQVQFAILFCEKCVKLPCELLGSSHSAGLSCEPAHSILWHVFLMGHQKKGGTRKTCAGHFLTDSEPLATDKKSQIGHNSESMKELWAFNQTQCQHLDQQESPFPFMFANKKSFICVTKAVTKRFSINFLKLQWFSGREGTMLWCTHKPRS